MSWLFSILVLICYYWLCVAHPPVFKAPKPTSDPPKAEPFRHEFKEHNGKVTFSNSLGQRWEFQLEPSYYYRDGEIREKNVCFGRANGSKIRARGKDLYDYVRNRDSNRVATGGRFQVNVQEAIHKRRLFYFGCLENQIEALYTCPPGQLFEGTHCRPIDPCTHKTVGETFADESDRRFYYRCPDGRFQCPKDTFFVHDSCRPKSDFSQVCLSDPAFLQPVSEKSFIKCEAGFPKLYSCPSGTFFSKDACVTDACLHRPDGSKVAFREDELGPFRFSSGYHVCRNDRVSQSVECPNEWDDFESKGDNLTFLPKVFENGSCVVPEFCTNVQSDRPDVVVPSHHFTKDVKNWANSWLFDQSVGYRCRGSKKQVFIPPPGERIHEFRSVSACDSPGKKVVLGRDLENYYDCDLGAVVACPKNAFFDGTLCRDRIENAHRYRSVDLFAFDHLDDNNNWMAPWSYSNEDRVECTDPESVYLTGYNVCSHPDCQAFPFLKQISASIQLNEGFKCEWVGGKVSKVETERLENFNFWTQRTSIRPEGCDFGSTVRTGHFMLDSVLYATCDSKQPFVFCPSSSTTNIVRVNDFYACNPDRSVFEDVLKANTIRTFFENHLSKVYPIAGARVTINGIPSTDREADGGILVPERTGVVLWSDRDLRLVYKMVMNHPPHTYFEDKILKAYKNPETVFITRYHTGQTRNPIHFPFYNVKESVTGFDSDATKR